MHESTGISTVGEAHDLGWKLRAYCRHGKHDGMKSIRECTWSIEVDLPTLTATHGRTYPLAKLATHMKCVRCGSRQISVVFEPPATPRKVAAPVPWGHTSWKREGSG
jgi:hypothetical protein